MRILCLILGFLLINFSSHSQLDSLLKKESGQYRFEKTFIRLNKQNFVNGETIWFKLYLQYGNDPSLLSSNCRIDILNDSGEIIHSAIYPVFGSVASGNIKLPSDLSSGRYFIKGAPVSGRKEAENYSHIVPISIINPTTGILFSNAEYAKDIHTSVSYPGDGLIAGISNTCFVKTEDQYHQPVKTTVMLVENNKDTLLKNETNSYGSCAISIMPLFGASYHLVIKRGDKLIEGPLLIIKPSGMSLSANHKENSYYLTLFFTEDMIGKQISVIVEQDFHLLFNKAISISRQSFTLKVPDSSLPSGIIRLVITDNSLKALGELFVFSTTEEAIVPVRHSYTAKLTDSLQENHLTIEVADTVADASMLVMVNNRSFNDTSDMLQENIINRFLLTVWLKYPASYLSELIKSMDDAGIKDINLLLNSTELNIPRWNNIKTVPDNYAEPVATTDQFITVRGKLKNDKKNISSFEGFLTRDNKVIDILSAPVAADGSFSLSPLVFFDSASIRYTLKDKSGKPMNGEPVFFSNNLDSIKKISHTDTSLFNYFTPVSYFQANASSPAIAESLELLAAISEGEKMAKILPGVTVTSKNTWREKNKEIENRYITTGLFRGEATYKFNLITDPPNSQDLSIMGYLRQLASVKPRLRGLIGGTQSLGGNVINQTSYYLNENTVTAEVLETIRAAEVAFVKCYWTGFITSEGNSGAIAVYTKKPEDMLALPSEKLNQFHLYGYSPFADFEVDKKRLIRTNYYGTLFWLPSAEFNNDYIFYSPLKQNKISILIEGMTADGRLIYVEQ